MNVIPKGAVGILEAENEGALPFTESAFCRKLCIIGEKQGMTVYVFSLATILSGDGLISGYTCEDGSWVRKLFPRPDVIYDRCFTRDRRQIERKQRLLSRLADTHPFIYLARSLAGKWPVYQALCKAPHIAPYLPKTVQYKGSSQLSDWLVSHKGEAFLKPQNGTHGKRTLYVRTLNEGQELGVIGRNANNEMFRHRFLSAEAGLSWIHKFTGTRPFLIQPYLRLNSAQGEPFDVRVLMQKDERGKWNLTGMAVRAGQKHSLTSNLHGGGRAYKALPFLTKELGEEAAKAAVRQIRELSRHIPEYLETHFGRLAELGIDFGVESQGNVWILEVNSKPGRSSFFRIGDPVSAQKSIENPISYARYLLLSRP